MKRLLLCLVVATLPFTAHAQADPAAMERMERLERDIMLLQRQVARGGPSSGIITAGPSFSGDASLPAGGSAQLEVRLSAIEEELRTLRGKIEENEFQVRKLSENFEKLQRDTEFRFSEMGGKPLPDASVTPEEAPVEEAKPKKFEGTPETPAAVSDVPAGPTTAGDGVLRAPDSQTADNFTTPRDHYNYAFRLLNQTKYDEAAKAFDSFARKYAKDPLVGNAYYWQGETYYIRRDYVTAADLFRQGFEALPNGPKAADNLLKLAMSLNALKRDKEACVVLGQITTKFRKTSTSVTERAIQEQKRIGCK
jgi:tol-pal system protein YbgF